MLIGAGDVGYERKETNPTTQKKPNAGPPQPMRTQNPMPTRETTEKREETDKASNRAIVIVSLRRLLFHQPYRYLHSCLLLVLGCLKLLEVALALALGRRRRLLSHHPQVCPDDCLQTLEEVLLAALIVEVLRISSVFCVPSCP